MKTNNNNNRSENNNAVNNAPALTIWDEVTISLNAFELLALRYLAKRDTRDNSSEYDNEKAAQLLAKIDEAEKAYKPNEMTVWEEVTISLNAFDVLAARYMIERVIKREGLTKYDSEKAAAILSKLAEAEKAYNTTSEGNNAPAEDDAHPEATETATEPAEGSEATDTTPATSEANSDRENKPQSHTAAKFGRKVAKVITRAALVAFRVVWFGAILFATVATLGGLCSVMADTLPAFFPLRLLAFLVCAAAAVGVELILIAGTRRIDRATDCRLFAMY